MWVLYLNDMRSSNIEILVPVARASTKEDLKAFVARNEVTPYDDGGWGKIFRQGGPLEWFNRPYDFHEDRHFQDVEAHLERIREGLLRLPSID